MKNFDQIVETAKQRGIKHRVVIAGADAENILLGAFEAKEAGFVTPILVGDRKKITAMLERLGLANESYRLVATKEGEDVVQTAINVINQGEGDILMRGNTQTRDFLLPLLNKKNGLRTDQLLTHIDLVSMPEYPKLIAVGDVTVTIEPNLNQKKAILDNMVGMLKAIGYEKPNIALLTLVEEVSFHMKDTVDADELVRAHAQKPLADCNLVGPIAYDLILSKEAARLKNYDNPLCGEFDGIVAPHLLAANLIVKGWQMHAGAKTCGVVIGANIPVALTSRSDDKDVSFLSLALCAALPPK
jgi:phosphotransacetylase